MVEYSLDDFFNVEGIVKHPNELKKIDFRMTDYHCMGLTLPMSKPGIHNKMPRNPLHKDSLFQGFDALGLKFYLEYVREWTVGYPGLKNTEGKMVIPSHGPIAKMIHFIWYRIERSEENG